MARRFGRRGRPNVLWLPTFGHQGDPAGERIAGLYTSTELTGDGTIAWTATPLTFDYTDSAGVEQTLQERSLQDLAAGNEWRLRRIVGKVHSSWAPTGTNSLNRPALVEYAAGFIVCKTDDDGNALTDFETTNPLAQDSQEDPWIWRRKWMLRTNPGNLTFDEVEELPDDVPGTDYHVAQCYPPSTAAYGSVADGPHIDQKTARVIHRQERLFFVEAVCSYSLGSSQSWTQAGSMFTFLDYRLLGSLRRASAGNRRNASR